ncbi:MAG: putative baseplate assembly protein [Methanosarcina sp.]
METKTPILRSQTSSDIYKEALELARSYLPELEIPDNSNKYFDPDDPALVILKLFSEMTELLLTQTNKIPDKYRLAFLDFIGLQLLPSNPARVPLTFSLSEGSSGSYVPAKTSAASSKDPSIVFETSQDLSVVATGLESVFSLNPWEDKYVEHKEALSGKEDGFSIFGGEENYGKKLDHIFYLGDDILLDIRKKTEVKIKFDGKNLSEECFNCWADGNNNPINITETTESSTSLEVSLSIPKLDKATVNGVSSFWLSVRPAEKKKINDPKNLPEISRITTSIKVDGIFPDIVIFNSAPLDLKKGFYPFGEEPKIGDTFYIGSEEVFSKIGASISLNINAEEKLKKTVNLIWEYWDGNEWKLLEIKDNTSNFLSSGLITFTCPSIPIVEINAQPSRWIRVKLKSGDYGEAGSFEQKDNETIVKDLLVALGNNDDKTKNKLNEFFTDKGIAFGFKYNEASFNPPFIKAIKISYNCENKDISRRKTYNIFQFLDFTIEKSPEKNSLTYFTPFIPHRGAPALYLGFKKNIASEAITLLFALKEQFHSKEKKEIFTEEPGYLISTQKRDEINLSWEYSRRDGTWKEFKVEDETGFFRRGGIVSFHAPSDIQKSFEFGKELYWIRARVRDSKRVSCPKIIGVFPNTVWALNNITVENEVLGSGNGEPDLTLSFSKKPVLKGQIIEVKEPTIPSRDELRTTEIESGREVLRTEKESEEVKEIWVVWSETRDFALSDSLSRHYMLDRTNGKITFGNGVRGMIPPRGKNNIVARKYQSGGGKRGDVTAGTLTSLKTTIPYIESVINRVPASGGMDPENIDCVISRGPFTLKNGGRAVTKEDFEWLCYEASQYVAKAKCVAEDGDIKIFIVPKSEGEVTFSEAGFLDLIERYLKERSLVTLSDRIFVLDPEYETIGVKIKFKPVSLAQSKFIAERIAERVKQFLHPLKGGQRGEGWDFGQDIYVSEMASVVEDLEGVDYVTEISITKGNENISGMSRMQIKPNSLPSPGNIEVNYGE